jgi:hypothetical protein
VSTYFTHQLDKPLGRTLKAFGKEIGIRRMDRYNKAMVKREHTRKQRQFNKLVVNSEMQETVN